MKIAVFSDVHGNLRALKAVLEQIHEKNVVSVLALGLEGASYLLIEDNEDTVCFEHIDI